MLIDYASTPGSVGEIQSDLGAVQGVVINGRGKLIISTHPHCPCTMATSRTLERLATSFQGKIDIVAFIYCPEGVSAKWVESSSTRVLRRIPGLTVRLDRGGQASARLGARTSGHVFYYDENGQLTFSGGITPGRGHEGNCGAAEDLLKRIDGLAGCGHWPVFGCQLAANLPETS